ncbi:MAG: nucleotidyltransferase domain-containing protein [Gemmatimonadaceae bacterium]|nr:nucleotidyltransferase domain-containing protein [Gemmatimonadaceae bacterium]
MMTPDRVRDEIRERILGVVRDRARAIYLYGSRAKGTARAKSDWDVAVVLRGPLEDWAAESLRLSALFYPSSYAVDLQVFEDEEFSLDATVPGTLPYTVALRGERLYDHAR